MPSKLSMIAPVAAFRPIPQAGTATPPSAPSPVPGAPPVAPPPPAARAAPSRVARRPGPARRAAAAGPARLLACVLAPLGAARPLAAGAARPLAAGALAAGRLGVTAGAPVLFGGGASPRAGAQRDGNREEEQRSEAGDLMKSLQSKGTGPTDPHAARTARRCQAGAGASPGTGSRPRTTHTRQFEAARSSKNAALVRR